MNFVVFHAAFSCSSGKRTRHGAYSSPCVSFGDVDAHGCPSVLVLWNFDMGISIEAKFPASHNPSMPRHRASEGLWFVARGQRTVNKVAASFASIALLGARDVFFVFLFFSPSRVL